MRKIKKWLIERILPVWARAELMEEIENLRQENEKLRIKIALRDHYIDGLRDGMKSQRRIVINNGELKK